MCPLRLTDRRLARAEQGRDYFNWPGLFDQWLSSVYTSLCPNAVVLSVISILTTRVDTSTRLSNGRCVYTIPGLEPESPRSRPQGLVFGRSSLPPSIFPGLLVQNARAPDRTLFYCTRWRELGKHLAPCLGRSVHSSLPPSIFPGLLVQNARAPDRTLFYCTRWRELGKHLAPCLIILAGVRTRGPSNSAQELSGSVRWPSARMLDILARVVSGLWRCS
ncbi:hypothetical protein RRG08_065621 [Elysia crispata]|uniref:Uncharacterized protein n=1 Tax=Elysia crispata TaxID=231223 RepID=A0AAE1D1P5_9GAST|nr:hypothetical protein RRG08_065621 [Elysia crispata]